MIKKLETWGAVILIIIGVLWGGGEIYLRKFADSRLENYGLECFYNGEIFKAKLILMLASRTKGSSAFRYLGDIYRSEGNITQAIEYYKKNAIKTTYGREYDYYNIAELFVKPDEINQAIKWYEKSEAAGNNYALVELRNIYVLLNNQQKVAEYEQKIINTKDNNVIINLKREFEKTQDYKKIEKLLLAAIKIDKKNSGLLRNLAHTYFEQKKFQLSQKYYLQTGEKSYNLAICFFKNNETEEAIKIFDDLVKKDNSFAAMAKLTQIHLQQKTLNPFIKYLEKQAEDFDNTDEMVALFCIHKSLNQPQKAQKYLDKLIYLKNNNTYYEISNFFFEIEDYKNAEIYAKKTARHNIYILGKLAIKNKNYNKAITIYKSDLDFHIDDLLALYEKQKMYDEAFIILESFKTSNKSWKNRRLARYSMLTKNYNYAISLYRKLLLKGVLCSTNLRRAYFEYSNERH